MDRASDYGSEGWGFDSLRAHRLTSVINPYFYCGDALEQAETIEMITADALALVEQVRQNQIQNRHKLTVSD